MVDGSGLENRRPERVRGFESHPLRFWSLFGFDPAGLGEGSVGLPTPWLHLFMSSIPRQGGSEENQEKPQIGTAPERPAPEAGVTARMWSRNSRYILPALGTLPIGAINTQGCLAVQRAIEQWGWNEMAKRALEVIKGHAPVKQINSHFPCIGWSTLPQRLGAMRANMIPSDASTLQEM